MLLPARAAGHLPLPRRTAGGRERARSSPRRSGVRSASADPVIAKLLRTSATSTANAVGVFEPIAGPLNTAALPFQQPARVEQQVPDDPPRLQPHGQASAVVLEEPQLHPGDAGHDEQHHASRARASRTSASSTRSATRSPTTLRSTLGVEPGQRAPHRRIGRSDGVLAEHQRRRCSAGRSPTRWATSSTSARRGMTDAGAEHGALEPRADHPHLRATR